MNNDVKTLHHLHNQCKHYKYLTTWTAKQTPCHVMTHAVENDDCQGNDDTLTFCLHLVCLLYLCWWPWWLHGQLYMRGMECPNIIRKPWGLNSSKVKHELNDLSNLDWSNGNIHENIKTHIFFLLLRNNHWGFSHIGRRAWSRLTYLLLGVKLPAGTLY